MRQIRQRDPLASRRSVIAGAGGLLASMAYSRPGVISDPFTFAENGHGSSPGWNKTNNKTLVSPILDGTKRNGLLLVVGQSNVCNVNPTSYVPTNISKIINFNPFDGGAYQATGSQLGCTNWDTIADYGNPTLRVADMLITNNIFDFVWHLNIAIGGTAVADWDSGGSCSQRIRFLLLRLASHGIQPSAITGVLWGQGETDTANRTSQASYARRLGNIIAASRALGITAPWFIAEQTYYRGSTSWAVQAAQRAIVNHGCGIWAGPNADLIGSQSRFDNLHFSDAGAATYAAAWYNSLVSAYFYL
jgi:hypothetical protein